MYNELRSQVRNLAGTSDLELPEPVEIPTNDFMPVFLAYTIYAGPNGQMAVRDMTGAEYELRENRYSDKAIAALYEAVNQITQYQNA